MELTIKDLTDISANLMRAVVLQQVEINALEGALAGQGILLVEGISISREFHKQRAQPLLDLISSGRPSAFAQAVQMLFPNPG